MMTAEGVPPRVAEVEAQLVAEGSPFALTTTEIDGQPIQVFTSRSANLRELIEKSVGFGDAEYLVATDGETVRRLTFAEHERAVASLAKVMSERYGVGKGDRVAILGANSIDWIITFWATISLGALACALNGWWTGPEIEYAIGYTEPKLLVADRKRIARVEDVDLGVPVVVMEDEFPTLTTAYPDAPLADVEITAADPAILLFTSGTTGRPKGAVHTHGNVCSLLAMLFFQGARAVMSAAPPAPDAPPPRAACQFMTSPLFHVSGLHTAAVMFLATGTRSVWWMGRFDPKKAAAVMEREQCTGWSITETVLHRFVHDPDIAAGKYDLTLVKTLGGGGSAVPPATQELARAVFPGAARSMGFGYGLTECTALATTNFGEELLAYPTSVGRPLPTVTIEIRDPEHPDAPPLPDGEVGEVWIRSPMVMRGYWRLPEATAEVVYPGGWLRTGDWGHLAGGRLFIESRRKDLILRGGENVYPAEIEARLVEHPGVDEVAVVGVPDPELGQAVKAIVVPRGDVDVEDLRAFCAAGIAYYKVPTQWALRSTPLPRNAMGKLLRDALDDTDGDATRRFVEE
jgi:acyl-CoA synthetase (AMP-forming)/AMP-acid ligase II